MSIWNQLLDTPQGIMTLIDSIAPRGAPGAVGGLGLDGRKAADDGIGFGMRKSGKPAACHLTRSSLGGSWPVG